MINDNSNKAHNGKLPFIGTRDEATGQIGKPLTTHKPHAEIRYDLCNIFNLVKVEDIQDQSFEIPIKEFLVELMNCVRETINESNDRLFDRFISFHQQGALTEYSQKFKRLMDGKLPADTAMESEITKLWRYHHQQLIQSRSFLLPNELPDWNIQKRNNPQFQRHSNMPNVFNLFDVTMNLLIMSMSLQYMTIGSREYYDDGNVITFSINEIKNFINKYLLNEVDDENSEEELIISLLNHNPSLITQYALAMNKDISIERIGEILKKKQEAIPNPHNNIPFEYTTFQYSANTTHSLHYEYIIKMLRTINIIQKTHELLLQSKDGHFDATMDLLMLNGR